MFGTSDPNYNDYLAYYNVSDKLEFFGRIEKKLWLFKKGS